MARTVTALLLLLLCVGSSYGQTYVANIADIATMQALGSSSASYGTVSVANYSSGTAPGGGGTFNWIGSSTAPNDSCTVFTASGVSTGRWIRQITNNALDYHMCGAVNDNSTDATVAMQAAENVAAANGYKIICQGSFKVNSSAVTITMGVGVMHSGSGPAACNLTQPQIIGTTLISANTSAATSSGSTLTFSSSSAIANVQVGMKVTDLTAAATNGLDPAAEVLSVSSNTVTLNLPVNGGGVGNGDQIIFTPWMFRLQNSNGLALVEAPKFFDMTLTCGACTQYNSPTGGFTDSSDTQMPFGNIQVQRVTILPMDGNTGVAIQISKANYGSLRDIVSPIAFETGIDLEGADSILADNVAIGGSYRQHWFLRSHGTFGNEFKLTHGVANQLDQTGHCQAAIWDGYRSSTIESTYMESGNIGNCPEIALSGGYSAVIRGNNISQSPGSINNWLTVTDGSDGYKTLAVTDNYNSAGLAAGVLFNGGHGVQVYKSSGNARMVVKHSGNFNESGYPFNSLPPDLQASGSKTLYTYSPSTGGLTANGYGSSVLANLGFFYVPPAATPNCLIFNGWNTNTGGSFDVWVQAYSPTVNQNISAQLTSNGTVVGSPVNAALTTNLAWYNILSNVSVSTNVGVNVCNWDTTRNDGAYISQVQIAYH